ncbi:MAG: hypothetical protein L6R38_006500 [Xanthoria sp. 2 TBL-2021]|nr:MAG: hypothetical protein L6R38_006500 [Xanthoria sp. 2 TBL-2021]
MSVYYQSRQSEIYGGTISLIILATVSVAVRLVARRQSPAKLWWDDFTVVVALVRYCGLGRHTNIAGGPVGPDQLLKFFKGFKKSNGDGTPEQKMAPSSIPLSFYAARHGVQDSTDTTTDRFVRLTEGNAPGNSLVTAHASEAKGDDLLVAPDAIIKQQRLEYHVE